MAGADQRHHDDNDLGRDNKPKQLPELNSELTTKPATKGENTARKAEGIDQ